MSNLCIEDVCFDDEVEFKRECIETLRGIGGVYFIFDEQGILLYIGKTNDFANRVGGYLHGVGPKIDSQRFSTVRVIREEDDFNRDTLEKYYISKLIPFFNVRGTKGMSEKCKSNKREMTKTSISIDAELTLYIKNGAEKEDRSFSQQIAYLVKKGKEYIELQSDKTNG